MATIAYEDKVEGGQFTHEDANEIKSVVNANSGRRVDSQVTTETITPNPSTYDIYVRTAQATNLTIANQTGNPAVGDKQQFIITDDGVGGAKTLGFGNLHEFLSGFAKPIVLISAKCTKMLFQWRLVSGVGKWDMVGLNQE